MADHYPKMTCLHCQRFRLCVSHIRSSDPPKAAAKWLRTHCRHHLPAGKPCDIQYTAGVIPRQIAGQEKSDG